ncbi:MAG: hypothetical protein U9P42_00170 [Candidatus Fermentibacteria bacterium]|nr:hypothetical protein [Candidatus Fermentibacteria bacterium]
MLSWIQFGDISIHGWEQVKKTLILQKLNAWPGMIDSLNVMDTACTAVNVKFHSDLSQESEYSGNQRFCSVIAGF